MKKYLQYSKFNTIGCIRYREKVLGLSDPIAICWKSFFAMAYFSLHLCFVFFIFAIKFVQSQILFIHILNFVKSPKGFRGDQSTSERIKCFLRLWEAFKHIVVEYLGTIHMIKFCGTFWLCNHATCFKQIFLHWNIISRQAFSPRWRRRQIESVPLLSS